MKVKLENTGPCRKTLSVEVPVESVAAEYDKIAREFAAHAQVPGYRRGKAPRALVEKRYRKAMFEEVSDKLVYQSYRDALKEKEINPVAVLDLQKEPLTDDAPMKYKVVLDVPPEFKLPKYKNIPLKRNDMAVTDEQVRKRFDELLDRMAEYKPVEGRPIRKGDLAQVDYEGSCDGKPVAEMDKAATGFGRGKDVWVSADQDILLPGMAAGILGMNEGESREIEIKFPADFRHAFIAGRTAVYSVAVKAIREKQLPKVDDAFLKQFDAASEDDLRKKIRESMEAQTLRAETERLKGEIVTRLLKSTTLDLPESVVQDETRHAFSTLVREHARQGMSKEQFAEKKDELLDSASGSAKDRVKLGYILHRIAEVEKIVVEDSEVDAAVAAMAAQWRTDLETVRKELDERKQMDAVRHDVLADKTLDFLLANAGDEGSEGFFSRLVKGKA